MAGSVGKIGEFWQEQEEWTQYCERLVITSLRMLSVIRRDSVQSFLQYLVHPHFDYYEV